MNYSVVVFVKPFVHSYYSKYPLTPLELAALKNLLSNPSHRDNVKHSHCPDNFVELRLDIPERWFYANLNALTPTNAQIFATLLERNLKETFERAIVMQVELCRIHGTKFIIKDLLLHIRDEMLQLDENQWPLESIIKMFQRFCKAKNIDYAPLKKLRAPVLKNGANSAKLPHGFLWLSDWLKRTGISKRKFHYHFRHEIPTRVVGNRLAVASADVLT